MKKLLALILCIAMVVTAFAGCSNNGSGYNDGYDYNVLRLSLSGEIETADVQLTTADYTIPMNIFDTLVEVKSNADGTSEIVGALAEDWDVSEDGKTYTFYLRKGVKFHNGEEFVADDVLYTIDRMLNPERLAKNSDCMSMIKGSLEMLDGQLDTIEGTGVTIIDDYTVEIHLYEAYAPFLANCCVPGFMIYNREAGDAADEAGGGIDGSKFGAEAEYTIGTGPFVMKDWQLNDHIYLETFQDYWKGASELDGVLFTIIPDNETRKMMFENGELDEFDLDDAREQIDYFKGSEEWAENLVSGHRVGTYYYSINESIEPFDDVRVRKALQMAID
ncbi:MAG: ABC transporter substrate-binding protein, partial [Firmicutes bacterium]|nr:ABC transporter substrate-binding protein [Bacillota bacterium]